MFERLDPGSTYGFGVALAGRALDRLREHDASAADRIAAECWPLTRWTMRRDGQSASVEERGAFGVARTGLLRTLQELATEGGAHVAAGVEAPGADGFEDDDAVIFADGVGSQGRDTRAPRFGAHVTTVPVPYIWCGAAIGLDSMTLELQRSAAGVFCGHVMPYGPNSATFQVDTLPETLVAAELGQVVYRSDGESDEGALRYLSQVFGSMLGDGELLGNRSRWSQFRHVTCERWSDGKTVLVGDAAHTAHYTVGSGTRMAMEDAVVLSQALIGEASLDAAFDAYEKERRPAVEHLQWRANRSQQWWRTLPERYDLPLPVLMLSYFTRTGSVTVERVAETNPEIVRAALQHLRAAPPAGVLASAPPGHAGPMLTAFDDVSRWLMHGRVLTRDALDGRVVDVVCNTLTPWSADTRSLALEASAWRRDGDDLRIVLNGGGGHRQALNRFDIAEEVRLRTGASVAVSVSPDQLDAAATAVAADRVDYVVVEAPSP